MKHYTDHSLPTIHYYVMMVVVYDVVYDNIELVTVVVHTAYVDELDVCRLMNPHYYYQKYLLTLQL